MKINEILSEAGFWKGVAQAIAPNTVARSDQAKNARPGLDQILSQNDTGTFEYEGEIYTWLGNMWGLQNPATGKFVPAPKAMQDQLNIASGSKNAAPLAGTLNQTPKLPSEVVTPKNIKVKKNQVTGKWYRQDTNQQVTDPREIQRLEQLAKNARQVAIARGTQTR
jgi:hypothetical protein